MIAEILLHITFLLFILLEHYTCRAKRVHDALKSGTQTAQNEIKKNYKINFKIILIFSYADRKKILNGIKTGFKTRLHRFPFLQQTRVILLQHLELLTIKLSRVFQLMFLLSLFSTLYKTTKQFPFGILALQDDVTSIECSLLSAEQVEYDERQRIMRSGAGLFV